MPRRSPRLAPAPSAIRGDHSEGRFQIRDSATPVRGRGGGAGRAWLSRSARNSASTRSSCAIACKEQPESKGTATAIDFLHLQVARVVDEADTGPLGPDPRNKRVYARERAEFCCALLCLVDHFSSGRRQRM